MLLVGGQHAEAPSFAVGHSAVTIVHAYCGSETRGSGRRMIRRSRGRGDCDGRERGGEGRAVVRDGGRPLAVGWARSGTFIQL